MEIVKWSPLVCHSDVVPFDDAKLGIISEIAKFRVKKISKNFSPDGFAIRRMRGGRCQEVCCPGHYVCRRHGSYV